MKRKMKNKSIQYIDNQLFILFLIPKKEKENNRLNLDLCDFPDKQDFNNQANHLILSIKVQKYERMENI